MRPDLHGGGQHHQASALIGLEAFRAAGDPRRYPEQIAEGLWPWQASKIYKVGYYGFFRGEPEPPKGTKLVAVESDVYDPLLGRTYAEIGSEARAMHKCQGFGQLLALPGSFSVKYQLADTTIPGQKRRRTRPICSTAWICRCPDWPDLPVPHRPHGSWMASGRLPTRSTPPAPRCERRGGRGRIRTRARACRHQAPSCRVVAARVERRSVVRGRRQTRAHGGVVPAGADAGLRSSDRSAGRRWGRDARAAGEGPAADRQSRDPVPSR